MFMKLEDNIEKRKKEMKFVQEISKLFPFLESDCWYSSLDHIIEEVLSISRITNCTTVQDWEEKIVPYIKDRCTRDAYNRTEDDIRYDKYRGNVHEDWAFKQFYSYLTTFEKLIQKGIVPLYPEDVLDVMYYYGEVRGHPEDYIKIDNEGNIIIEKLKFKGI